MELPLHDSIKGNGKAKKETSKPFIRPTPLKKKVAQTIEKPLVDKVLE